MIFTKLYWTLKRRKLFRRLKGIGENVIVKDYFDIGNPENLHLECDIYIGPNFWADCRGNVNIERGVIIGPRVKIHSVNHRYNDSDFIPYDNVFHCKAVHVKENVWIGSDVIILPGVIIEEGAIIGTGSVVTKNVPPYAVMAGNPARFIKFRDTTCYLKNKLSGNIYMSRKYLLKPIFVKS